MTWRYQLSKEDISKDTATVDSELEEVDRDTTLQLEQCAYDCLGKCWPPSAAHTQGISTCCWLSIGTKIWSSSILIRFFITNLMSFCFQFFAPVFPFTEIMSGPSNRMHGKILPIYTHAKILLLSCISDSQGVWNPFCDFLRQSPVPLGRYGVGIESHLLSNLRY